MAIISGQARPAITQINVHTKWGRQGSPARPGRDLAVTRTPRARARAAAPPAAVMESRNADGRTSPRLPIIFLSHLLAQMQLKIWPLVRDAWLYRSSGKSGSYWRAMWVTPALKRRAQDSQINQDPGAGPIASAEWAIHTSLSYGLSLATLKNGLYIPTCTTSLNAHPTHTHMHR